MNETESDKIKEYCGLFGAICNDYSYSVAGIIYSGLMSIQHRGQIFAGLSISNCRGEINSHKEKGLVSKALSPNKLRNFSGNVGIGHVCYGRPNCLNLESAQPYRYGTKANEFSIALNGSITNRENILKKLDQMGRIVSENSDIEIIATLITSLLGLQNNRLEVFKKLFQIIKGTYCILIMFNDGTVYAIRDPTGCKPLCYGKVVNNGRSTYLISSESCSIDVIGGEFIADIEPGEILKFKPIKDIERYREDKGKTLGVCFFEYVYFARPDSTIDGVSVAQVRYKLGENLADNEVYDFSNPIVVPVPDSGRSAAMGYSWKSKILYQEGLMKNRYLWKLNAQIQKKLNPIKSVIEGHDIILVDDSIVSGHTMREIIRMLRKCGTNSIHVRISCPPVIKNCNLNDVFATRRLLIAHHAKVKNYDNFNEDMLKYIDADSLLFQTYEGLIKAVGKKESHLCTSCIKEFCSIDETIERNTNEMII